MRVRGSNCHSREMTTASRALLEKTFSVFVPKRVLDLGCGAGRDCYVCSALAGEVGSVTGVDMVPAQVSAAVIAELILSWTNAAVVRGFPASHEACR